MSKPQAKQESMPTGMAVKEVEKSIASDELSSLISIIKQMMGLMVMLFVVIAGLLIYLVIDRIK